MRATVAFIIPTTAAGTERRGRALRSLLAQSDPDWFAVAVANGPAPYMPLEARYFSLRGPSGGGPVAALNVAINHLHLAARVGDFDSEWVTALDDHDTVSEETVARLKQVGDAADVVIFRTHTTHGLVFPHPSIPVLAPTEVGNAVMFRRAFMERAGVQAAPVADYVAYMLTQAMEAGARVLLHPSINYFEKDHRPRV